MVSVFGNDVCGFISSSAHTTASFVFEPLIEYYVAQQAYLFFQHFEIERDLRSHCIADQFPLSINSRCGWLEKIGLVLLFSPSVISRIITPFHFCIVASRRQVCVGLARTYISRCCVCGGRQNVNLGPWTRWTRENYILRGSGGSWSMPVACESSGAVGDSISLASGLMIGAEAGFVVSVAALGFWEESSG